MMYMMCDFVQVLQFGQPIQCIKYVTLLFEYFRSLHNENK